MDIQALKDEFLDICKKTQSKEMARCITPF